MTIIDVMWGLVFLTVWIFAAVIADQILFLGADMWRMGYGLFAGAISYNTSDAVCRYFRGGGD